MGFHYKFVKYATCSKTGKQLSLSPDFPSIHQKITMNKIKLKIIGKVINMSTKELVSRHSGNILCCKALIVSSHKLEKVPALLNGDQKSKIPPYS